VCGLTFVNFELIVVDDSSTLPLEDICNEFGNVRDAAVGEYVSLIAMRGIFGPEQIRCDRSRRRHLQDPALFASPGRSVRRPLFQPN